MSKKNAVLPFRVLKGSRVVIKLPEIAETTDSGIILNPEDQKKRQIENVEEMLKIIVVMVGTGCIKGTDEEVKPNDKVYVQSRSLQPGVAEPIIVGGKTEWLIIAERDIVGIY
jgi:co-chaperonin GroES (HSP10)